MKRVGVREFRDHASRYLASDEVLAIERHGEPIGFYIPAVAARTAQKQRTQEAMEILDRSVEAFLVGSGLTEDELARLFDLTAPLEDEVDVTTSSSSGGDATRR